MLNVPADDTEETFLGVSDYTKISVVRNMLEWTYLTKLIHRCSTDYFMKWHQNEMSDIDVSCQFCKFYIPITEELRGRSRTALSGL